MPQQNMQELAHALFQYIKEVCQADAEGDIRC